MTILFHIECPTCRARLQVRSAAAIGQILTCPKCGGMVQVEPPPDWRDPEAEHETVEEIEPPQEAIYDDEPTSAQPEDAAGDTPFLPGDAWVSTQTEQTRRRLLYALVAVVMLLLVGLLGWRLMQRQAGDDSPSLAQHREDEPAGEPDPDAGDGEQEGTRRDKPNKLDQAGKGDIPPGDDESDQQPDRKPDEVGGSEPGDNSADPESSTEEPVDAKPKDDDPDRVPGREDQTDGDAAPPGLSPADDRAVAEEQATTALSELESMIHPPDEEDGVDEAGTDAAGAGAPARLRRRRDVAALLNWKLPQLSLVDLELNEFAAVVREVSGVPISIDLDRLSVAGIDWRKKVSGHWENATLQDVVDSVAKPLGIEFEQTVGGLRLTAKVPAEYALRFALEDLPGGESESDQLPRRLSTWLGKSGWKENAAGALRIADGEAIVTQADAVQRVLRSLQARYLLFRRQQATADTAFAKPLDTRLTFVAIEPTPLAVVLRQLAELADVEIVVDWESAALVGCESDAEVTIAAYQQPLAIILRDVLTASELTFRRVDDRTVVVRGAGSIAAETQLEFHPIPQRWGSGDDLTGRMKKLVQALDADGARGAYYDPRARCLILLGTARDHAVLTRALQAQIPARNRAAQGAEAERRPAAEEQGS